jgi:hypothetical protein
LYSDAGPWNNYELIMRPVVGLKKKETGDFYPFPKLLPEAQTESLPEGDAAARKEEENKEN